MPLSNGYQCSSGSLITARAHLYCPGQGTLVYQRKKNIADGIAAQYLIIQQRILKKKASKPNQSIVKQRQKNNKSLKE